MSAFSALSNDSSMPGGIHPRLSVPTARLVLPPGAPEDQWLEARTHGLGGSDAAGVLNISPWVTPMGIYLSKIGLARPFEVTEAMAWGTQLEAAIAEKWAADNDTEVWSTGTYAHRERDWQRANPDRLGNGFGLEVKTCDKSKWHEWGDGDELLLPDFYLMQVVHYAAVTGIDQWIVICLIGGNRLVTRHVEVDAEDVEQLTEFEHTWWETHVRQRNPPMVYARDNASMARLYRRERSAAARIELPRYLHPVAQKHRRLKTRITHIKAEVDELEVRLKAAIGEHAIATIKGRPALSWKAGSRVKQIPDPSGATTPTRTLRNLLHDNDIPKETF